MDNVADVSLLLHLCLL